MSELTEALERLKRKPPYGADLMLAIGAARKWAALDTEETREAVAIAAFHAYNPNSDYELLDESEWEGVADAVLAVLRNS